MFIGSGFEDGVLDGDGYCPECGTWQPLYWFQSRFGWDDDFTLCEGCSTQIGNALVGEWRQEQILKRTYGTIEPESITNFWELV